MIQRILVVGATGKTGRRLIPRLLARGVTVRAAARTPAPGLTPFDWQHPQTHDAALNGMEAVYLVPPAMVENPAEQITAFLRRAVQAGVQRVVALSSLGVTFAAEPTDSGRRQFEQHVMDSGIDWTLLRPNGFFQNFSEGFLLPGIRHAAMIASACGEGAAAMVDADDIAAVAEQALLHDGHVGTTPVITGPEALSFTQVAKLISRVAGRTIGYQPITPDAMARLLGEAGVPPDYAAMLLRDMAAIRDGEAAGICDSVDRICARPAISFEQYADAAADAWR
jgi:uncharacterized protein YbjT (DUF2867 family)